MSISILDNFKAVSYLLMVQLLFRLWSFYTIVYYDVLEYTYNPPANAIL